MTSIDPQIDAAASTATPRRLDALDGCRAIAALSVLVFHTYLRRPQASELFARYVFELGNFGVAVFFVLSGFLLYQVHVEADLAGRPHPSVLGFYRRRIFRIYPAYWVAFAITVTVIDALRPTSLHEALSYLLLTQNWRSSVGIVHGLLVAWTLSIEVMFYVALPMIAWAIRRFVERHRNIAAPNGHLIALGVLAAIGMGYRLLVVVEADSIFTPAFNWLPNFLDWFALGMALAVLVAWRNQGGKIPAPIQRLADSPWFCWFLTLELYWVLAQVNTPRILVPGSGMQAFVRFALSGLAAVTFVLPAIFPRSDRGPARILSSRVLVHLGLVSYGIYLYHLLFIYWVANHAPDAIDGSFFGALSAVLILTIPVATLSYRLVEKPAQRFGRARRRG